VDVGALSPRVKQPGREADHSHPCSMEVKYVRDFTLSTDSLKVCSNGWLVSEIVLVIAGCPIGTEYTDFSFLWFWSRLQVNGCYHTDK
jgi:hypothetical protein